VAPELECNQRAGVERQAGAHATRHFDIGRWCQTTLDLSAPAELGATNIDAIAIQLARLKEWECRRARLDA
jgi:hypothetical protein